MVAWILGSMFGSLVEEDNTYFVVFLIFCPCIIGIMLLYNIPFSSFIANCVFSLLISPAISMCLTNLVGYKKLGEILERERKNKGGKNDLPKM